MVYITWTSGCTKGQKQDRTYMRVKCAVVDHADEAGIMKSSCNFHKETCSFLKASSWRQHTTICRAPSHHNQSTQPVHLHCVLPSWPYTLGKCFYQLYKRGVWGVINRSLQQIVWLTFTTFRASCCNVFPLVFFLFPLTAFFFAGPSCIKSSINSSDVSTSPCTLMFKLFLLPFLGTSSVMCITPVKYFVRWVFTTGVDGSSCPQCVQATFVCLSVLLALELLPDCRVLSFVSTCSLTVDIIQLPWSLPLRILVWEIATVLKPDWEKFPWSPCLPLS